MSVKLQCKMLKDIHFGAFSEIHFVNDVMFRNAMNGYF